MRWRRRTEKEVLPHEHDPNERELAIEAVERELHLRRGHPAPASKYDDEATGEEEQQVRPRRRYGWLVMSVLIGIGVGGLIILIIRFVDGPAEGTNTLSAVEASLSPAPTPPPDNTLAGAYVSFKYPGPFNHIERLTNTGNDLEDYLISTASSIASPRATIAAEIMNFPANGLKDDPAYRLRSVVQANVYTPSTVKLGGDSATMMTKTDGTEQTLFWPHGSLELTISISTTRTGDSDTVDAAMKKIMNTAQWKS